MSDRTVAHEFLRGITMLGYNIHHAHMLGYNIHHAHMYVHIHYTCMFVSMM